MPSFTFVMTDCEQPFPGCWVQHGYYEPRPFFGRSPSARRASPEELEAWRAWRAENVVVLACEAAGIAPERGDVRPSGAARLAWTRWGRS